MVTLSECASHAVVDAQMGGVTGKGSGEQALARWLYARLEPDWLLIADRNFYNWADWCTAADTGAQLLWRVKADLRLPVLDFAPDGSYTSPQLPAPAPLLPARGQTRPPQLLSRQTIRRHRHPTRRASHDQTGQPRRPPPPSSMIKLS